MKMIKYFNEFVNESVKIDYDPPSFYTKTVDDWYKEVVPEIKKGISIIENNTNFKLISLDPKEVQFDYATFKNKNGDEFSLKINYLEVYQNALRYVVKKWDDIIDETFNFWKNQDDVFYDDVNGYLKQKVKSRQSSTLAFIIIVDLLENSGVKVHS